MSGMIERRIAAAAELADWLGAQGHHARAQQLRGIGASLAQFRRIVRENTALRKRLTPIAQARMTEARRGLNEELSATAALLDRTATIADASGADSVGLEALDATYLADLLRRAAI
jgi:hypothetical protein